MSLLIIRNTNSQNIKTVKKSQRENQPPSRSTAIQAAQKWLSGQARPTPDKIDTLAEWLNVSAQWLRFGIAEKTPPQQARSLSKKTATNRDAFSDDEVKLIQRIRTLSAHQRYLIAETVEQFALDQEMWHD